MALPLGYTVNWEKQDGVKCIAHPVSGIGERRWLMNTYTHRHDYIFFFKGRKTKKKKKTLRGKVGAW